MIEDAVHDLMKPHLVSLGLAASLALVCVSGCKIIYDSDRKAASAGGEAAFDAKSYVQSIWEAKVLPLVHSTTLDVTTLLDALARDPDAAGKQFGHRAGDGQPWTFLVKGEGKATAVDVKSRHGTLALTVQVDGKPTTVLLQIGPVIFGTALRDSLPFVSFNDFVNQIDYAEVSRALNDKATAGFAAEVVNAAGHTISFTGAATAPSGSTPLTVTPVLLSVGGTAP
jgi:predicted lipoprotein